MKLELTNKNYCGTVVKIDRLIELDNCDSVQHANIFGNLVIVSKRYKKKEILEYIFQLNANYLMNS